MIIILIILFLSTSCIPIVTANDGKPDLKIIDVKGSLYGKEPGGPALMVVYTNEADVLDPIVISIRLCLTVKTFIFPLVIEEGIYSLPTLYPNEIKSQTLWFSNSNLYFGIYRCYFEIDPFNKIVESNENNNIAWALFFIVGIDGFAPIRIGRVHFSV